MIGNSQSMRAVLGQGRPWRHNLHTSPRFRFDWAPKARASTRYVDRWRQGRHRPTVGLRPFLPIMIVANYEKSLFTACTELQADHRYICETDWKKSHFTSHVIWHILQVLMKHYSLKCTLIHAVILHPTPPTWNYFDGGGGRGVEANKLSIEGTHH